MHSGKTHNSEDSSVRAEQCDQQSRHSTTWLYLGSQIPKCMLIVILVTIYAVFSLTFLLPLINGKIDFETVQQQHQLMNAQQNSNTNDSSWIYSSLVQLSAMQNTVSQGVGIYLSILQKLSHSQRYGICLAVIFNLLCGFLALSIYKVTTTSPGRVSDEWISNVQNHIDEKVKQERYLMQSTHEDKQKEQYKGQEQEIHQEEGIDCSEISDCIEDKFNIDPANSGVDFAKSNHEYQSQVPQQPHDNTQNILNYNTSNTFNQEDIAIEFHDENDHLVITKADSKYQDEEIQHLQEIHLINRICDDLQQKNIRFCKKCKSFKPPRTHHCRQCSACVTKMDHHCQWLDSCVGDSNYKFFLLVIFYANICLLMVCLCYSSVYLKAIAQKSHQSMLNYYLISVFYFFCLAFEAALLSFGLFHFSIIEKNMSTIEFCEQKPDSTLYNSGAMENLRQVFGDNYLFTWFLPIAPRFKKQAKTEDNNSNYSNSKSLSLQYPTIY